MDVCVETLVEKAEYCHDDIITEEEEQPEDESGEDKESEDSEWHMSDEDSRLYDKLGDDDAEGNQEMYVFSYFKLLYIL